MNEYMNTTSIRLAGPQSLLSPSAPASKSSERPNLASPSNELKQLNQHFDEHFRLQKELQPKSSSKQKFLRNTEKLLKPKDTRITPLQAKIIASQGSFGQKPYNDPASLK